MTSRKIVNLKNLQEISGGEESFTKEIIDMFLSQSSEMVNDIETAYKNNNGELLKKKVHKFKSSAYIFGIEKLIKLLMFIEANGFSGLTEEKKLAMLKKIKTFTRKACVELRDERKKYS
jgi:HPt (histidine-containing phosphotransfer) domain-containing protein